MLRLNNKTYDVLKYIALIVLPAFATMYLGFGQLWEWPATDKVVASIVLFNTFLGIVLQINTVRYNNDPNSLDGFLDATGVHPDTGLPNLKLVVTTPPEELLHHKTARLKIGLPPEH